MSRPAPTGRKTNAEEAGPARGAAGRPQRGGWAGADFRARVGDGNFYFEGGGCDGGSCGGGGR